MFIFGTVLRCSVGVFYCNIWMKRKQLDITILDFLDKYHDIKMSKRTLLNRLKQW
jgi:hypothetical protein